MDKKALLEDAKRNGFAFYSELIRVLNQEDPDGPELDEVLQEFEKAHIKLLPDSKLWARAGQGPSHAIMRSANDPEMDDEPLQIYLREVAKVPPLTPESEIEFVDAIANDALGAEAAKRQLVEAHLGLVVTLVDLYQHLDMHPLDLIQQGNEGIIKAAGTFKYGRGYKFSTYAAFWVHRSLHELV